MARLGKWGFLIFALTILALPEPASAASGPCWDRYNSCSKKCLRMSDMTTCFALCADIYFECTSGGSGVHGSATIKGAKVKTAPKKLPAGGLLENNNPGFSTQTPSGAGRLTAPPAAPAAGQIK